MAKLVKTGGTLLRFANFFPEITKKIEDVMYYDKAVEWVNGLFLDFGRRVPYFVRIIAAFLIDCFEWIISLILYILNKFVGVLLLIPGVGTTLDILLWPVKALMWSVELLKEILVGYIGIALWGKAMKKYQDFETITAAMPFLPAWSRLAISLMPSLTLAGIVSLYQANKAAVRLVAGAEYDSNMYFRNRAEDIGVICIILLFILINCGCSGKSETEKETLDKIGKSAVVKTVKETGTAVATATRDQLDDTNTGIALIDDIAEGSADVLTKSNMAGERSARQVIPEANSKQINPFDLQRKIATGQILPEQIRNKKQDLKVLGVQQSMETEESAGGIGLPATVKGWYKTIVLAVFAVVMLTIVTVCGFRKKWKLCGILLIDSIIVTALLLLIPTIWVGITAVFGFFDSCFGISWYKATILIALIVAIITILIICGFQKKWKFCGVLLILSMIIAALLLLLPTIWAGITAVFGFLWKAKWYLLVIVVIGTGIFFWNKKKNQTTESTNSTEAGKASIDDDKVVDIRFFNPDEYEK